MCRVWIFLLFILILLTLHCIRLAYKFTFSYLLLCPCILRFDYNIAIVAEAETSSYESSRASEIEAKRAAATEQEGRLKEGEK